MGDFSGKTIFITGASRGIGQAIALRFAKEHANVVITAKENSEADKQSIDETAKQVLAAGGKPFPLMLNVNDDNEAIEAVNQTVAQFGGIDVLVNNVSAFCFADTTDITPKEFDTLISTNVRATFLLSKLCIPHLKKASNPHIINIAPPLDMEPRWFKNHLAFTMSKYGMSMCTLGMSAEFKNAGVAVNSLWPQTTIATTTIQDHFKPEVYSGSRWPSIVADAAFILTQKKASNCTGNFFIDEMLLRENGVTDFSKYAVDPDALLVKDLFIPTGKMHKSGDKKETFTELVKNLFLG